MSRSKIVKKFQFIAFLYDLIAKIEERNIKSNYIKFKKNGILVV